MRGVALAILALLLASCSGQEPSGTGETVANPTAEITPPAVDLAGHWRVAGIDGEAFDRPYAITLVADAQNIWWQPECALQYREYSVEGSRFIAPVRSNAGLEVCDIGFPEELTQIWEALEAADTIERTPENGIRIYGNGRSLLLFSQ